MYLKLSSCNVVQYYLVLLLIIVSGSIIPFVFSTSYSPFLIFFLITLILFVFIFRIIKLKLSTMIYFLFLIVALLLLLFIREDFDSLMVYFGFIIRIICAYLLVLLISKDNFIKIFTDLMVAYSIISLIMYFSGLLLPDFIFQLPTSFNDARTGYRHTYFYFFQGIDTWNKRNAGIFWEAGAYQVFLSLALVFELNIVKGMLIRRIILVAAIISTFSTIGLLVLLILSGVIIGLRSRMLKCLLPVMVTLGILISGSGFAYDIAWSKFSHLNASGSERFIGMFADLQLFLYNPIVGVGVCEYREAFNNIAYSLGSTVATSSNSFTGMLALNGIFYTLIMIVPIFLFFLKMPLSLTSRIVMLGVFVLLASSQGLLNQVLFICLAFYGLQSKIFISRSFFFVKGWLQDEKNCCP